MTRQPFTAEQRRDLAVMAHQMRRHSHDGPPWDVPGIDAAIARCGGTPCDIAAALFALAGDPAARTPGLLPLPGKHWPARDGATTAPTPSHNMACHEHPDQVVPCARCRAEYTPASPHRAGRDGDHPRRPRRPPAAPRPPGTAGHAAAHRRRRAVSALMTISPQDWIRMSWHARALADPPRPETIAAAKEAARRARSTR